ncbi:MarR family winged helix-turn-helix transcriptional regulator [Streptomyces sp. WMMB 322]|uniref:MarR family winged helix-turn-helix transcriptional regulator n=1 Tax=Streptomyces sp. WMMB 322 TaxID=1286821 RepID=UPI0006E1E181|nr:MarR family winged helix-turn-helix transcriptional regulator [Streptomyces sp. WMMB 322]SCK42591.1 transcriptional regulator, MarR family [Streptomyces sp. WMMB 322]
MSGNRDTGRQDAEQPGTGRGPGQVLFEFVRHWSRRPHAGESQGAEQGRLVLVTEAVHSLTRRGPATVNAVAREIGIDQSNASRLVKSAIAAGHLRMRAADADGRRRELSVTPAGLAMLDKAHRWQEAVFDRLTEGWSEEQRAGFRQAMLSLLERSHAAGS